MDMADTLSPKIPSSPNMLKLTRPLSWSLQFTSMVQGNQQHPAGLSRWLGEGSCLHSSSANDTCSAGPPYIQSLVVFSCLLSPQKTGRVILFFTSPVLQTVTFAVFVSQSGGNRLLCLNLSLINISVSPYLCNTKYICISKGHKKAFDFGHYLSPVWWLATC